MTLQIIRSHDGTGTLSYLLTGDVSRAGVLIDPNMNDVPDIVTEVERQGIDLRYIIDTHTHVDHVSGAGALHKRFGAPVVMHENTVDKWKAVDQGDRFGIGEILRANAAINVDRHVSAGDVLSAGSLQIHVLFTPGHTDNHISLLAEGNLFTGDLLLIGQAGRSDLPGGDPEAQYESLFTTVLSLPASTRIFPGHDYEGNTSSTLEEEKRTNPFLTPRSKEEYIAFVADFFPPLAEAAAGGAATLQCGTKRVFAANEPFNNISPAELSSMLQKRQDLFLLDVREPYELIAFGAIPGVVNIPVGQVLDRTGELPADRELVVVCQSGNRSSEIARYLALRGFQAVFNLTGGTSAWARAGYPLAHPKSKSQQAR